MMRLDVATLSIHTGTAAAVQSKVEQRFRAGQGAGTLCASWTTEIGGLNRVLILRAFDDSETMHAGRDRMLVSGDIFGAGEHLLDVTFSPSGRASARRRSHPENGPRRSGPTG
ncbi:MAG TPA: NIPSNAP family protein [Casimicrobiaceae bacterium]|nr:NIPSNAP family protein [Casimicrobiaceae bacterium]